MFLLVPAQPVSHGQRVEKQLLLLLVVKQFYFISDVVPH